jgi:hypothetical protein
MSAMLGIRGLNQALWLTGALFHGFCLDPHCANWTNKVDAASSPNFELDLRIFRLLKAIYPSGPLRLQGGRAIYGTLPAKAKPELRDLNLQVSSLNLCFISSFHFLLSF